MRIKANRLRIFVTGINLLFCGCMTSQQSEQWTVLKHYDQNHLLNISLPLGGIGTGVVGLLDCFATLTIADVVLTKLLTVHLWTQKHNRNEI
jgi:hypothetical protein